MNARNVTSIVLRVAVAGIYGVLAAQKIPYHPNTQAIFEDIGGYPAALATVAMELVAAVLILVPKTVPIGALLSMGAMLGAITTHLVFIGVQVQFPSEADPAMTESDGGTLFAMAVGTLVVSAVVLALHGKQALRLLGALRGRGASVA
ncbi:MAG: MauE/DoxX family redox-associated membrane protein [Planctomycetota bacterium]